VPKVTSTVHCFVVFQRGKTTDLAVQLQNDVVRGLPSAKGEVHNAVYTQLPHVLQPPRAHVLAQLQRKVAWRVRPLLQRLQ